MEGVNREHKYLSDWAWPCCLLTKWIQCIFFSLNLKASSSVQVSLVSDIAGWSLAWQNSYKTDHHHFSSIFPYICPLLPLPCVRSWSRVSLKNILERRTRNSTLDILWPPSVRAKRWKMIVWMFLARRSTTVHLVSNLILCQQPSVSLHLINQQFSQF